MIGIVTALITGLGSAISGFFGFKNKQGDALVQGLQTASNIITADTNVAHTQGAVVIAETSSGYWLTASWRPLLMIFFASLIGARWFGYVPPNMSEAELFEMYGLLKLGLGGYIGSRGLEKIVQTLALGPVIKEYIRKRLS